ncbi:MAG: homoserine kinase [Fimbriimonadaceae bacterium]|nr:homoserine kinase [Fimbriimonadaceae bacterium]
MIVRVEVPATSANLGPGFDCLGLALELRNSIVAEALPEARWEVTVSGAGAGQLPANSGNLVAVAMRHLFQQVPGAPRGCRLQLVNRVPLCSGLGSSATAKVGGLVAANALCGHPFDESALMRFCVELEHHPDNVIPCLLGGLVVAVVEGGEVHALRVPHSPELCAVVTTPDQQLPTAVARQALPAHYERPDAAYNVGRAALLVTALAAGRHDLLGLAMRDRIHQPYRLPLVPGSTAVLDAALAAGALGAVLSGSGPSLLALVEGPARAAAVATAMREAWAAQHIAAQVDVLAIAKQGTVASLA